MGWKLIRATQPTNQPTHPFHGRSNRLFLFGHLPTSKPSSFPGLTRTLNKQICLKGQRCARIWAMSIKDACAQWANRAAQRGTGTLNKLWTNIREAPLRRQVCLNHVEHTRNDEQNILERSGKASLSSCGKVAKNHPEKSSLEAGVAQKCTQKHTKIH